MPETGPPADELRERAAAHDRRRNESFARCDTDGFVSQWADGLIGQLCRAEADILDAGGKSDFVGLYQGGRRVKAREISTRFGESWLLHEDEIELRSVRGKPFLPTGANSWVLKRLGLREARETAPAAAKLAGSGHGLSGSAWVQRYRTGCRWGGDAVYLRELNDEGW
jgi:hypothetical protein